MASLWTTIEEMDVRITLLPNIMELAVSPRWRGDGPMVITNEVRAVPAREISCSKKNFIIDETEPSSHKNVSQLK